MPNIGSVKSSEAHPQSAVALHGKQLLDSLRHECPLRSTGTAGTAACHKGFLEGRGLQPHAHPQLFGKIHGQAGPKERWCKCCPFKEAFSPICLGLDRGPS